MQGKFYNEVDVVVPAGTRTKGKVGAQPEPLVTDVIEWCEVTDGVWSRVSKRLSSGGFNRSKLCPKEPHDELLVEPFHALVRYELSGGGG
jgi:hypothetical protein